MSEGDERPEHETPQIDVSKALHEAGHEVEELGFEGIPDTGPVIHAAEHHDEHADDIVDSIVLGSASD